MPGNEFGDSVHNFFAQDSLPQVQHGSPIEDVNWPTSRGNMWTGSQRQIGLLSSNMKNYNLQNSDSGRGISGYPFNGQHGLNFTQPIPRPEFAKSQSQSQQPNLNGYMYDNQFYHTRQDDTNFPAVDTSSDQRHIASGGSSFFESQQWLGPEQHTRVSVRSEPSDSPVSGELFGGQQISLQQSNMLHSLQRQQSGINDMQQFQQQVMFMKMQELQRQQQLRQLEARQQSTLNQVSSCPKVASGVHSSALVNGTADSGALTHSWANELGSTNWSQHGSPVLQGSSSGLIPTNNGQAQRLMGLIPQQIDQSLYGVPVSSSRPSLNQFSQGVTDKQAVPPMPTVNSSFPANQYAPLADQVSGQDGIFLSKQGLQVESAFGDGPGQAPSNAMGLGVLPQADAMQKASAVQEFCGRQDIAVPPETSQEEAAEGASPSQNEVGLDPTEERILFGSDDNMLAAFGKSPMSGEGGNPFDGAELLDGTPSIQGGTWSALMQSAVAETSSNDVGLQEQWTGLNFHSAEIPSGSPNLTYNSERNKGTYAEDNLPQASSLNSVSVHPAGSPDMRNNYHNVLGQRFPFEPGKILQSNSSQRLVQSSGDAVSVSRENSFKCSQDYNQKKFIQGEVVHRGAGWNSNLGRNTTVTMGHTESSVGSPLANSEVFSLHNSAAIPNSSSLTSGEETSQFFQNNHQSSYWQNADPVVKSIVSKGEVLQHHVSEGNQLLHSSLDVGDKEGKMHETENSDKQENSNDSHRSNLSPHSSAAGVRGNVMSDARDSRLLPTGKHKLSNEVGRRTSWANKFQYHPMGNVDKYADPTCGMKHPTHSQPMLQQSAHGSQSMLAQVPTAEAKLEKVRLSDELTDGKGYGHVHSGGSFPGGGSNMSMMINKSIGLPPNMAPKSSPDMLQLLQKADPSRERGSTAHFNNYEHKASSDVPEAENSDGSAGHLRHSQSSAYKGFGLQLGPPSQQISVQPHLLSSQGPVEAVNSSHSSHSAAEIREKSRGQTLLPHQAQSLPVPSDLLQRELKHNTSGVPGSTIKETERHNMYGSFSSASGHTYLRNQLQNPHMVRASGQDSTNQSFGVSFEEHTPHSTEKGDSGSVLLPDGAGTIPYSPPLSMGKSQLRNFNGPHGSVSTSQASSKEPVSASPSFLMPGISLQGASSKKLTNMRTNFPPPPHLFSSQYSKDPSHIPQPNQMNIMESSLSAPERHVDQDANKGGTFISELGSGSVNSMHSVEGEQLRGKENTSEPGPMEYVDDSQGRESIVKNLREGSPANSASMQRDIEAFGRSLKPNSFPNQSYSLLNQMWTMKNAETDPSNLTLKRMKVADSSAASQQVRSDDSRMQNFSGPDDLQRSVSLQHGGRMTPHNVAFCPDESQTGSHNSNTSSVNPEQTQISPHMAPSWFNQYGSFKNGQMLQMYDAHRAAAMKTMEQPLIPANSTSGLYAFNSFQHVIHATADRSQIGNLGRSSVTNAAGTDHFSSLQTLPMNIDQRNPIMKPKKRRRATSEFTSWYKEISLDLCSDQTISLADIEWAKAVNRLTEKVKEIDSIDDGPPRLKARRRLVLTTQLMQQLFYPPPAAFLFADAKSEYESVAYSISRFALGDACGMVSCSNADTNMPHDGKELLPDKCNTSERNDRHHFTKAVEELMGRARKLESDFVSLDKRASVADMKVEELDLEKFSIFLRFVKFHGRGPSSGAESSSTDAAAAHSHKPGLEECITVLPVPKILPNSVQCLSL
ncbi:putative 40S ribosomal protein S19-3-like [Capsicum annuum]|uniref:Uncharacterized protein n=1 Tax=Capsicum annuum TaxID=4072 RepID=A0A2G3A1Y5_CAPAN|nr:uncharacterized protein LOC107862285 [Capsicum annuum]KAF3672599.1 putative 40S ribosomal protein S19-3-like [Capsicum annuum]KAF3678088.1 putative 40S ribosomal protein S19-3-like [Capsicum annuum]PHT88259.1 hypothetical protein T459_10365 [Capsicum annuum]